MGIDYTKRPKNQPPPQPPATTPTPGQQPPAQPVSLSKITLTKSAPSVSCSAQTSRSVASACRSAAS